MLFHKSTISKGMAFYFFRTERSEGLVERSDISLHSGVSRFSGLYLLIFYFHRRLRVLHQHLLAHKYQCNLG
jgi:hypothetical protein